MNQKMKFLVRATSLMFVLAALSLGVYAQTNRDYHKFEAFGGYSYERVSPSTRAQNVIIAGDGTVNITDICSSAFTDDLGPNLQSGFYCSRRGFDGFDGSATYNLTRYVGIQADLSGHFKSDRFIDTGGGATTTVNTRERLYNFLGGVQIKNNKIDARLKPFAHALVGPAHYTGRIDQVVQPFTAFNSGLNDSFSAFAMKIGGGLDMRVNRRVDIRAIEIDYNPIFARDRALQTVSGPFTVSTTGKTTHNFSFGVGMVFH